MSGGGALCSSSSSSIAIGFFSRIHRLETFGEYGNAIDLINGFFLFFPILLVLMGANILLIIPELVLNASFDGLIDAST